eukprot:Skav213189  [mRNA]  locus=scaffold2826:64326:75722:+ [translate_table: standard]
MKRSSKVLGLMSESSAQPKLGSNMELRSGLDDGSAPPSRKAWQEVEYDQSTRTFRGEPLLSSRAELCRFLAAAFPWQGVIEWDPAFKGSNKWIYRIEFSEDFAGIVAPTPDTNFVVTLFAPKDTWLQRREQSAQQRPGSFLKNAVAEVPEAKKMKETLSKYGVEKSTYDRVVEAIQLADDVPNSVRQMLIAMLPEGICVPANLRHEYQKTHVNMILEILEGVLSKLQQGVTTATGEVARIEASKSELQGKVQEAIAALEKANEGESSTKGNLAEVTQTVLACKSALAEKEKERVEGDAAHEAAKEEKSVIEQALAEEFRLLRDGEVEGDDAKASLMTALPTSILKKPADRGSFDAMVVAQLQEGLQKRLAQLTETIQNGEPAAAARLAAVDQAKKDLETAKLKQQDSDKKRQEVADLYLAAKQLQKDCQGTKKGADAKVKQAEPDLTAAKKIQQAGGSAVQDAEMRLEKYKQHNWASFESLRDHAASKEVAARELEIQMEEAACLEAAEAGA